ncbi:MAG: hypothetical protein ACKO1U_04650, partial [Bacteroidota bacterium]
MESIEFITTYFFEKAAGIPPETAPVWGKMSPQQMVEHLSDAVRMANGGDPQPDIVTPADRLPAVQEFLRGEREFKPNTRNSLMSDTPPAVRNQDFAAALVELRTEVDAFVRRFEAEPGLIVRNPF